MNTKVLILLAFCASFISAQVVRSCTAAQSNINVVPTPFPCGAPNSQKPPCNNGPGAAATFLNCPSKEVIAARGGPCGGGGSHAFWFTNQMFDALGCRQYIFTSSQGVSTGLFNEVDTDNDGIYDRAALTGTLRCDGNPSGFHVREMSVNFQLNAITRPGIKNELSCSNSSVYPNFWYFYNSSESSGLTVTDATDPTFVGTFFSLRPVNGKSFQVGLGASMKNLQYGLTTWLTSTNVILPNGTSVANTGRFNPLRGRVCNHVGDINVNLRCSTGCPDTPPPPYCGNGIVENGEQCDPPGPCCTSNCFFRNTTTVCRPVAGDCDVAEFCSGTSATCPTDAFLPSTTVCRERFGICEVTVSTFCPGNGPSCKRINPFLDAFSPNTFTFFAFNAISFNNFIANTGDTEGRVAVRNNFIVGNGYSVNDKYTPTDRTTVEGSPFALFVGGTATWGSGQLYPIAVSPGSEGMFIGSLVYSIPTYLEAYVEGNCAGVAGCANEAFDRYQSYYTILSNALNGFTQNVQFTIEFQALKVQCLSRTATAYTVNIDAAQFNQVTWYVLMGCNPAAVWIINIQGTGNVTFNGDSIPAIAERVVYNIPGSGRTVLVNTEVRGNMLGPNNILLQPGGVIKGIVIFGSIDFMLQINTVNCIDLILVSYTDFATTPLDENNCFVVRGGYGYAVGDEIFVAPNTNTRRTVISKEFLDPESVADRRVKVCLSGPLPVIAGSKIGALVDPNIVASFEARNDEPSAYKPATASSAGVLSASFALLVALVAFFF